MSPEKLAAELQELLTPKKAAEFLGVTRRTIQNYRKAEILIPHTFDKNNYALYTKGQLICAVKSLLKRCETFSQGDPQNCETLPENRPECAKRDLCNSFLSKQPEIVARYEKLVKRYSGKERFQIYSITQRIVPNFKLCKVIYNLEQQKYSNMVIDGKQRKVLEKKKHKKFGDIVTTYRISNSEDYDNTDPLNEFDYAVFSVCVSYFDKGYQCITVPIIYRALTGKSNTARVTPDLREAILFSLKKLIGTTIEIDESEVNSAFKYADFDNSNKFSAILPAHLDDKIINGQDASVVYFDRESPLMEIAHQRNQLLRYDVSILNAPDIRNTIMNIMLKSYVIRRVVEIKAHKQLKPTLTFDDIFKKCRIENDNRDTKMNARNTIVKFFEHLQSKSFIKSFELFKQDNAFHSIHFIY